MAVLGFVADVQGEVASLEKKEGIG